MSLFRLPQKKNMNICMSKLPTLPGLKSIGCLHDFWCCRNKWSNIAPYSSCIRCISFICSATFSMPLSASVCVCLFYEYIKKRQIFACYFTVICLCINCVQFEKGKTACLDVLKDRFFFTYLLNVNALRSGDQLNFLIAATTKDTLISSVLA